MLIYSNFYFILNSLMQRTAMVNVLALFHSGIREYGIASEFRNSWKTTYPLKPPSTLNVRILSSSITTSPLSWALCQTRWIFPISLQVQYVHVRITNAQADYWLSNWQLKIIHAGLRHYASCRECFIRLVRLLRWKIHRRFIDAFAQRFHSGNSDFLQKWLNFLAVMRFELYTEFPSLH